MGADGWLGLGWPPEYGGQGRGPVDQMILVEQSHRAGVPRRVRGQGPEAVHGDMGICTNPDIAGHGSKDSGQPPQQRRQSPADASATKVFDTELALEVYRGLMDIVGESSYLSDGAPAAVLRGRLEEQYRSQTIFAFGGGTNEIQRDIIAMIGLSMPRAPR